MAPVPALASTLHAVLNLSVTGVKLQMDTADVTQTVTSTKTAAKTSTVLQVTMSTAYLTMFAAMVTSLTVCVNFSTKDMCRRRNHTVLQ